MSWTLAGIEANIKKYINPEGSAFSTGQTSYIKTLINSAIDTISIQFPINELKNKMTVVTKDDYSTGTVTVTKGSKTVTGLASVWDYKHIGMKIRIAGARDFYVVANVTANTTLTLDRAFLADSVSAETYTIFENTYPLLAEVNWISGVFNFNNGVTPLVLMGPNEIEEVDPALQHSSNLPEKYSEAGQIQKREPYTGTFAIDAGSNTLTVIESTLLGDADDYYVGWTLVNTTRSATATVTAYTSSSKTLTIDEAITSQTTGDTCYLISNLNHVSFYRRPTIAMALTVKYYRKCNKLINDYDMPLLPESFMDLITFMVLQVWYGKDPMSAVWKDATTTEFQTQFKKYATTADAKIKKGRRQPSGRLITFSVQE